MKFAAARRIGRDLVVMGLEGASVLALWCAEALARPFLFVSHLADDLAMRLAFPRPAWIDVVLALPVIFWMPLSVGGLLALIAWGL